MNRQTLDFILAHANHDVRQLALSKVPAEIDLHEALQQIEGRQLSNHKLPTWTTTDGLLFPPRLNLEQCSSEATALYKRQIVEHILSGAVATGTFIDLTGGFGVDFCAIAPLFKHAIYIEHDPSLCTIARNNLPLLGCNNAEIHNTDAESLLSHPPTPLPLVLFIDPARRDDAGRKVALIEDCKPDVCALQASMRAIATYTLIKLSPMLDIKAALRSLNNIQAVHVVSASGECKELLLLMGQDEKPIDEIPIHCVDLKSPKHSLSLSDIVKSTICFTFKQEHTAPYCPAAVSPSYSSSFLYEPNASILKAGAFKTVSQLFPIYKLAQNSHLYISQQHIPDFPGRKWKIIDSSSFNKKSLKQMLSGIQAADLTVRGFPMSVATLRKQLGLREGGDTHLIATTLADNTKILFRVSAI